MRLLLVALIALTSCAHAPTQVSKQVMPSIVVLIVSEPGKKGRSLGSGAIISEQGHILTCAHLFGEPDFRIVVRVGAKELVGTLVAKNDQKDLALVRVFPMRRLPALKLGEPVIVGQTVYAVGAPLGVTRTFTTGRVSNLDVGNDKRTLHTAPINPGNSGGPLLDARGNIVGVNVSVIMLNWFSPASGMFQAVSMADIRTFLAGL